MPTTQTMQARRESGAEGDLGVTIGRGEHRMPQLTITEALQEIKTIGKRLDKKRAAAAQYLARDARARDPLEKDGGSAKFISEERQAIADLETRVISIRTHIQIGRAH